jgi:hypothetical protein
MPNKSLGFNIKKPPKIEFKTWLLQFSYHKNDNEFYVLERIKLTVEKEKNLETNRENSKRDRAVICDLAVIILLANGHGNELQFGYGNTECKLKTEKLSLNASEVAEFIRAGIKPANAMRSANHCIIFDANKTRIWDIYVDIPDALGKQIKLNDIDGNERLVTINL